MTLDNDLSMFNQSMPRAKINDFPLEVLREIFVRTRPLALFETPSRMHTPLSLTEVSRGWREVAIGSPELWTSLKVVISMNSPDCTQQVEQWLQRSHPFPLSLSLTVKGNADTREYNERVGHGVFEVFQAYQARWQRIYIQWAPGHAIPFADMDDRPSAPLMTSIILRTRALEFEWFHMHWAELLKGSPLLTQFMLSDPTLQDFDCSEFLIGWKFLTNLELDVPLPATQGLQILGFCPLLTLFAFRVANSPDPEPLDMDLPMVKCEQLMVLRVDGSQDVWFFFDKLKLYNIEKIHIDYHGPVSTTDWQGRDRFDAIMFTRFLMRGGGYHLLESLVLRVPVRFDEATCIEMMAALPLSLEHLRFENIDRSAPGCVGSEVFRRMISPYVLTVDVEIPPVWLLCPWLRCLSLIAVTCEAPRPGIIMRMIQSRGHWLHSGGAVEYDEDHDIEIHAFVEHRTRDFRALEHRALIRPDLYSFVKLGRPGVNYNDPQVQRRLVEIWKVADDESNLKDWVQEEIEEEDEDMDTDSVDEEEESGSDDDDDENDEMEEESGSDDADDDESDEMEEDMACDNEDEEMDSASGSDVDSEDDSSDDDAHKYLLPRSLKRQIRRMKKRGDFDRYRHPDEDGPYAGVVRGLYGAANALPVKPWKPQLIPFRRPRALDLEGGFVLR